MKFEITHRVSGEVLFTAEVSNLKLAVELAVSYRANLEDANLEDANLRGANLGGANLEDANLRGANLEDANLEDANLGDANLRGANLEDANLGDANLEDANLEDANLRGANLGGANLRGANLRGAKGINPYFCTPLLMLLDQPGSIRAYKLVNEKAEGPFNGGIRYEVGRSYSVDEVSTNPDLQCGQGINLATLDWCLREWKSGYHILIAEFEAGDIAAIPTATDGKFRVRRCRIVGEKALGAVGLVEKPSHDPEAVQDANGR